MLLDWAIGTGNSVIVPSSVTRATLLPASSLNHIAPPSGSWTSEIGRLFHVGIGNSSSLPSGVTRPTALPTSSVNHIEPSEACSM